MEEEIKQRYNSFYQHFNDTMVHVPNSDNSRINDRAIAFTAKHFNMKPSEIENIIK